MGSGKKDLEIVYNLQWKNASGNGNDKANIVGMYDTPSTTLNWETFKSYLLKNSGTTGDDVKVSYINTDDKEFPIDSQLDFQIALYSFRQRARMGETITLKLDRIPDCGRSNRIKRLRHSLDSHVEVPQPSVVPQIVSGTAMLNNIDNTPPEWFTTALKELKKDIVDEITAKLIPRIKMGVSVNKMKSENSKQLRKSLKCESNEKDLKCSKLERKLDVKMEKLEQKMNKIKEAKSAVTSSSDNEPAGKTKFSYQLRTQSVKVDSSMNASTTNEHESIIPHMNGGETYVQEWKVINSGKAPWTTDTELRYAWGSEALKPLNKVITCPKLAPGEKTVLSAHLAIPRKPGSYECYWHFYHKGRRFGHWLGCQVIVDEPVTIESSNNLSLDNPLTNYCMCNKKKQYNCPKPEFGKLLKDLPISANKEIDELEYKFIDTWRVMNFEHPPSESDNRSIISLADSNSSVHSASGDEFVVVPMEESLFKDKKEPEVENVCIPISTNIKIEKIESLSDDNTNNVEKTPESPVPKPVEQNVSKYAYVVVDNEKVAVPKHLLRPDYLETAEDAPEPIVTDKQQISSSIDDIPNLIQNLNFEDSAQKPSDENKKRLFVFPSNCPGFEIVYPPIPVEKPEQKKVESSDDQSVLTSPSPKIKEEKNKLHRRFGSYMRYKSSYNHSKCRGAHCQQPLYSNTAQQTEAETENFSQYSSSNPASHENLDKVNAKHLLSDNIVAGAVSVASSAINTARSVLNMFSTSTRQEGKWENGHWTPDDPDSPREKALKVLSEMGFWNRDLNATLLARYNDDVAHVISELVQ